MNTIFAFLRKRGVHASDAGHSTISTVSRLKARWRRALPRGLGGFMGRSSQGRTSDRWTRRRRSAGDSEEAPLTETPKGSLALAGSILDLFASLRDRPRPIDLYIDYFGGAPLSARRPEKD
jgi:hypothetical protein